jgi:chromosome segregation ATPase
MKEADWLIKKEEYESQIADLTKDNQRLQKKVQNLTQKLEDNEKEHPNASSPATEDELAELDDLKKDKTRLERKVEKLTAELEVLRESNSKRNPVDDKSKKSTPVSKTSSRGKKEDPATTISNLGLFFIFIFL